MYKYLIKQIIKMAEFNAENADKKDVQRSSFTAGQFSAFAAVLRELGHEVDNGSYEDDGCDRVAFLKIGGKVLIRNGEIDYIAVRDEIQK